MPLPKTVTMILKPKNLRFIVLFLFLSTAVIAIVHIFNESNNDNTDPTSYQNLIPIDEDFESLVANLDDTLNIQDSNNNINQFYSSDASGTDGNRQTYTGSNTSRTRNQDGKCSPIKTEFKPDFDAAIVYPSLQFDGSWIHEREYWNHFFEERFQTIKKSKASPTLKVFVIPHSHTDPGWLKTFEEYFYSQTKNIIDNAVDKLIEFEDMTFQWSEMSFLSKWWEHAHPTRRSNLRKLVDEKRFEIVTGGWVMTDEATVHLYSMIDQLIEGQQWAKSHLGVVPTSSWSVDPFGHGSTFPYILKTSGITGMVIQRIHYAWKKWLAEFQKGDFEWTQRWDTTRRNSIFCHNAPFDIYSIKHSCGPHPHICLNFDFRNISGDYSENYNRFETISNRNVKAKAELLLEQYGKAASLFPHNIAMISLGDDFRFARPIEWDQQYLNYMKLFNYINEHKEQYRAEVKFGTISQYFKAVQERMPTLPTFSGDFFTYSDIFSEGRPAYWSGYFSTRPFWKKFYRETENSVRSAEILFTFANALARQKNRRITTQALNHEYGNLVTARRWLGLFAHHDATTGTSKVQTMNDYGVKLMEAFQIGLNIQILAINSMLFGQTNKTPLFTDFDQSIFGELPKKLPIKVQTEERIVLFNNLAWQRNHIVKIFVTTPDVEVIGPNGQSIPSQLNPIFQLNNEGTTLNQQFIMSSDTFELSFLANLPPLSLSTFIILKASANTANVAVRANVYCRNCSNPRGIFEINRIQAGNIQLTNNRLQLLFDRNTGFLLGITRVKDNISVETKLSFGAYTSVDYRSGAYLLKTDPNVEIKAIPFDFGEPTIFITSGPIYSELTVLHSPILLSTRITHVGGEEMEEAVFVTNQVDVGLRRGEVFMRFNTDMDSTSQVVNNPTNSIPFDAVPTFYTDQNGFTVEKRIKIFGIRLEGNYYPVTSMSYIEDNIRGLRFSILVDRAHGFSSFEKGRLEAMIERRTIYDDARGMGEGVTDNKDTISNYIILLEKISEPITGTKHRTSGSLPSIPTLNAHHLSQNLNYPPSLFIMGPVNKGEKTKLPPTLFYLINQEFPCDSHLINLRTMAEDQIYEVDTNIPSRKALMITQRLGYHCPESGKIGCGTNLNEKSLFYSNTKINLRVLQLIQSDLTGINSNSFKNITSLEQIIILEKNNCDPRIIEIPEKYYSVNAKRPCLKRCRKQQTLRFIQQHLAFNINYYNTRLIS